MDNLEKLKIFGTHGTIRKQNKYYTETLKDEKRLTPRTTGRAPRCLGSKGVSDCCLVSTQQLFSYIMIITSYFQ
jgi:hypothetical protein